MKYSILLCLFCLLTNCPTASGVSVGGSFIEFSTAAFPQEKVHKKQKKHPRKRSKKPNVYQTPTESAFLLLALCLTAAAIITLIIANFGGIFLFVFFFVAGFFWFLSGLFATMSVLLLLVRIPKSHSEQNHENGFRLLLLILARIGFFIFIGFVFDPLATIILLAIFIPAFVIYLITMLKAFRKHATEGEQKEMFNEKK